MDTSTRNLQDVIARLMVNGDMPTPRELAEHGIDQQMLANAYGTFTRRVHNLLGDRRLVDAIDGQWTPGDRRVLNMYYGGIKVFPLCGETPLWIARSEHTKAVREGEAYGVRLFLLRSSCEFLVVPTAGEHAPYTDGVEGVAASLTALLRPGERYYEVRPYTTGGHGRRPVDVESLAIYLLEGLQRVYHASDVQWQQGANYARTAAMEIDTSLSRISLPG